MIVQLFDKDILKVLTVFSISPGSKLNRKELQEKTRLNNVGLDNAICLLLNSNIISKEKRLLSLNFDNGNTNQVIGLIHNQYKKLKEIPLDIYFSLVDIVFLLSKFKKMSVYLFGSYAKLVFKENSDIDIAIIADGVDNENKKEINRLVRKLERKYVKNIELHYFSKDFYKNKKDPLVKDILKNGVKLI